MTTPENVFSAYASGGCVHAAHLPENVVDVPIRLDETICELIVLMNEVANVDAAQRICLRKGEGHWESVPAEDAYVNDDVDKERPRRSQTHRASSACDHSPEWGRKLTVATLVNSSRSLTTMD